MFKPPHFGIFHSIFVLAKGFSASSFSSFRQCVRFQYPTLYQRCKNHCKLAQKSLELPDIICNIFELNIKGIHKMLCSWEKYFLGIYLREHLTYHTTISSCWGFPTYSQYKRTLPFSVVVTFDGLTVTTGGTAKDARVTRSFHDYNAIKRTIDVQIPDCLQRRLVIVDYDLVLGEAPELFAVVVPRHRESQFANRRDGSVSL